MWSKDIWGPALAGAAAFWVVNLAISLTPVAADYRAALSISYIPMLVEAAIGGIAIGLLVSWALLRFPDACRAGTQWARHLPCPSLSSWRSRR